MLKRIDHITINVKDVVKTIEFYQRVFGMEITGVVDMGDHKLTYMALPGGCMIELIEYYFQHRDAGTKETDIGIYRHVAFEVESIAEMKKRCNQNKAQIKLEPVEVEKLNCKTMLIQDPNGVEIELIDVVSHVKVPRNRKK